MKTLPIRVIIAAGIAAGFACRSSNEADADAVPAHGVLLTATDSGTTSMGRVIRVHFVNTTSRSAFLPRCGPYPVFGAQTFAAGQWYDPPPIGIACIQGPPGPVEILGGDSLVISRTFLDAGRYRFVASVASRGDLSDPERATSNAFVVP